MDIKQLCKEAHQTAIEKGWYETERTPLEIHALIHSEISEATEEVRRGMPPMYVIVEHEPSKVVCYQCPPVRDATVVPLTKALFYDGALKPEGELIELADAVIRIADTCENRGWDLEQAIQMKMQYNKTRPYKHGGKKY